MSVDLDALPPEDDFHEYKAGATPFPSLKEKLSKAASAFWNSGGGTFLVGADSSGVLDQGTASTVGSTPLRDWMDQVLMEVQPAGPYDVQIVEGQTSGGHVLPSGNAIPIVTFRESHLAPHMAADGRYYVRAGAHSVPARSFIVEALWARRHQRHPQLVHMLREKRARSQVLQLHVVNISPEPALDVVLKLEPLPEMWKGTDTGGEPPFPRIYPVVDRQTPIEIDVATWTKANERIGQECMVELEYTDALGRTYQYKKPLYVRSFTPWDVGGDSQRHLVKGVESLSKAVEKGFRELIRRLPKSDDE